MNSSRGELLHLGFHDQWSLQQKITITCIAMYHDAKIYTLQLEEPGMNIFDLL